MIKGANHVKDESQSYLEKFTSRVHRTKYKIGENPNKFNPHMVRDGSGMIKHSPKREEPVNSRSAVLLHTKKTTKTEAATDKPWYMLSFEEVIEIHSVKKEFVRKKVQVPHPGFGSSSKPRINETFSKSTTKPSTSNSSTPKKTPLDAAAIEESIVKNRRMKVADLESEIDSVNRQIEQVEHDAQVYYKTMQRTIGEAEKSEHELAVLKLNTVGIISSARGVILKLIEKNRQNDTSKKQLQMDIKRWEKANKNSMNAYSQSDVDRMSDIILRDQRRKVLKFFVRKGLIRFANKVMSRDRDLRVKWRLFYNYSHFVAAALNANTRSSVMPTSNTSGANSNSPQRKKSSVMESSPLGSVSSNNRKQSLVDLNRKLSVMMINSSGGSDSPSAPVVVPSVSTNKTSQQPASTSSGPIRASMTTNNPASSPLRKTSVVTFSVQPPKAETGENTPVKRSTILTPTPPPFPPPQREAQRCIQDSGDEGSPPPPPPPPQMAPQTPPATRGRTMSELFGEVM